jgi:DegV family protein with EDD domain
VPVAVLSDAAAALPPALAEEAGVVQVPFQIALADRTVNEDQLPDGFLATQPPGSIQSAAPPPGAYLSALQAHAGPEGAVVVTVASRYSASAQAAHAAATLLRPTLPVVVVDSGTAAGAQALVVLAAARAARAGADLEAVAVAARRAATQVRLVALVEKLDWLRASGRLPAPVARLGLAAGVLLLFELTPAGPRPLRPLRSRPRALRALARRVLAGRRPDHGLEVVALHAERPKDAEAALDLVASVVPPTTAFVSGFGPVMVAHTGPGVVGLAWRWVPPT